MTTCFLCVFVAFAANAQNYLLLKGQTRDTMMAPVAFANVMAIDTATQEMKGFAVTDVSGNFQMRIEKGKVYELKITFVGYMPISEYIRYDGKQETPLMVIMKEAINALDQVTVVAEMPVIVRGDTISYKAKAFAKGDERKLEDVLEELPGFNIRDNGDIEVQGQRVEKVLVDGKEFFEGDTKLATKNIPADVVDRVQVLQNFNDIAPMQGLMDNERLAINIELKPDKKRIVFGDVEAGAGPEERYFGHANAFYYAPKASINFIGDGNNIGELALSVNDYFRMSGGLSSMATRSGTTYRINAGDIDIPVTDRNSASDLTSYLGAFNFTASPSDKLRLSGFLIGFDTESVLGSNSFRTYPQLAESTEEQLTTSTILGNQSGLGRFSFTYKPNYNLQVDYNFFGKRGDLDQLTLRNSTLLTGSNELAEDQNRKPASQTHQLRMFNAMSEKNIISAELSFNEESVDSNETLTSLNPLFEGFFTGGPSSTFLSQTQQTNTRQYDGAFNYYYILSSKTHLNAAFGISHSSQRLNAALVGEAAISAPNQTLEITNRYLRLQYKRKWDKLTVSPALSFNNYLVNLAEGTSERPSYLFPQITMTYDFGSSHSLDINYRESLEYNDVAAYTQGFILQRYNTLLFGNNALLPARTNTISVSYRNFNSYNFFNIFGGINYQYIKDGFTNNQELVVVENVLNRINSVQANQVSSLYLSLEKRFNHIRLSGRADLQHTVLNNQFEGQLIENENFTQQYTFNASARLFKKLSIRTGYTVAINRYNSGLVSSKFINQRPTVSTTYTVKGIRFDAEYAFNKYRNPAQNQTNLFDQLDASISYRNGKSPWQLKVQGLNLLNTTSVRRDSFSDNLISTYAYNIQKRVGLLTVMYDI